MDQQPTSRLRAWLSRQSQQQADGTYLIRPFRPLPIIYQIDAETNRRWIAYQVAFSRSAPALIGAYVIAAGTLGLPVWCAALLLAGNAGPLILLRGAHRVPRRHWSIGLAGILARHGLCCLSGRC